MIKKEDLYKVVSNKLDDSKHDYQGRVLFVIIKCDSLTDKDFDTLRNKLSQIKQNNFQSILFLYRTSNVGYVIRVLDLNENGQWQWGWNYGFVLHAKTNKIMSTYEYYHTHYKQ